MKYIPHYDQNTAIRHGTSPTARDISARALLLKEKGMIRCGETLLPNKGYVPIFEGPVLTPDEQNLLCLIALETPEETRSVSNAVRGLADNRAQVLEAPEETRSVSNAGDTTAALIKEYQAEFRRANGHEIQQEGTQILINGQVTKKSLVERFLVTLKARNA